MKLRQWVLWLGMLLVPPIVLAQTTVTTSGGTAGSMPVFTGASTIGNSNITQYDSNIGIDDATSGGGLSIMSLENGLPAIYAGYSTSTANAPVILTKLPYLEVIGAGNGNDPPSIGLVQLNIGASASNGATWEGPAALYLGGTNATTASAVGTAPVTNGNILGKIDFLGDDGSSLRSEGVSIDAEVDTAHEAVSPGNVPTALNLVAHGEAPIVFYTGNPGGDDGDYLGDSYEKMRIAYNGNVGIGTTMPGAKLEVDGNFKLSSGSGASITFADGTVQSTAYTGVACGGDYAESVKVQGKPHRYAPGDVLVISDDSSSDVAKSQTPYSTEVVGVYSTKPGYVGRRFTGPKSKQEVPMAMIGIVPVKVSAENGPIRRGDLLVTSSTPGYAMKGTDRNRMLGAVLGKALGSLSSGKGVIEAVITLQ